MSLVKDGEFTRGSYITPSIKGEGKLGNAVDLKRILDPDPLYWVDRRGRAGSS